MRFRRKAAEHADADDATVDEAAAEEAPDAAAERLPAGPYDADELPDDDVARVDLGSLLVAPGPGRDLRVQVDEKSGTVRSVVLSGKDGAVELRAYAAPRNGDLWEEVRPQIAADANRRGGTATEQEGRFGTELVCEVPVTRQDGQQGTQTSRVVGLNGPRWLLRATFLGTPARDPEVAAEWDTALTQVAVRRGQHAMPVGEQLPLTLPEGMQQAREAAQARAAGATTAGQPQSAPVDGS